MQNGPPDNIFDIHPPKTQERIPLPKDPNQLTLPGTPEVWSAGNGRYRVFIQDRRTLRALLRIPGVEQVGSYFTTAGRPHGWQVELPADLLDQVRKMV